MGISRSGMRLLLLLSALLLPLMTISQAVAINETLVVNGEESIRLECGKKTTLAFFTLQAR